MLLSLAGYLTGGEHHGWLGEWLLLGENELAGFRNAQQVFLPVMEYDDFSSTLHKCIRSRVVIRFRDGDDPDKAGSSRLGSGMCAMLDSISIQ